MYKYSIFKLIFLENKLENKVEYILKQYNCINILYILQYGASNYIDRRR
jgi:hypothetical protein